MRLVVDRVRDAEASAMTDHPCTDHPELRVSTGAALGQIFQHYGAALRPRRGTGEVAPSRSAAQRPWDDGTVDRVSGTARPLLSWLTLRGIGGCLRGSCPEQGNIGMGRPNGGVVLVVDDNLDTNEALTTILEYRGYRTVPAYDGCDALAELRAGLRPAVIVLDLAMPEMDGPTFLREMLADHRLSHIPVVIYSARADGVPSRGVAAYVRKAQDPDVLLTAIASLAQLPPSAA